MAIRLRHLFFKSELFKKNASDLRAWDEVDKLKRALDDFPLAGPAIPGGDGLRKVRIGLPGRGKRGGARVIYYCVVGQRIFLVDIYAKNEKSDLSADELENDVRIKNLMLKNCKEPGREKKPS